MNEFMNVSMVNDRCSKQVSQIPWLPGTHLCFALVDGIVCQQEASPLLCVSCCQESGRHCPPCVPTGRYGRAQNTMDGILSELCSPSMMDLSMVVRMSLD
jgi:hypothetical protein